MTAPLAEYENLLDIRMIPPHERHPVIFRRFNSLCLCIAQSLDLLNDHNPEPLRLQLQERVLGKFEWVTLENGPNVWRLQTTHIVDAALTPSGGRRDSCCSGGACCG